MIAAQAGRGIRGDHAQADPPSRIDAFAYGCNFSHDFVAEDGGRLDHSGVVAALPYFQIGTIGQRETDAEKNFIGANGRHVDLLDAQILAAIEYRRGHL
jgi:hypothetical protein